MYKFNPISGTLDLVSPDNFSYQIISSGVTLTVPQYQQMVVMGYITIIGTLILIGDLALVA